MRIKRYFGGGIGTTQFMALHAGVPLAVLEIMDSLLKVYKWHLSATDLFGNTAVLWAAKNGHAKIVEALPDIADCKARTLFLLAAKDGHEGIAEMLLERTDAGANRADEYGQTLLSIINWG